ncbi:hypothetical protein [Actinoplanes sp. NPDC049316]
MSTEQEPPAEPDETLADRADAPELPTGVDVRPGPELTDEPEAGATEPTD